MLKTIDSEIVFQATKANWASNSRKISVELGISKYIIFTTSAKASEGTESGHTLPKYKKPFLEYILTIISI